MLPGGLYRFEDAFAKATTASATIVTCRAWLLELYELEAGHVSFLTGARRIRSSSRRCAAILPPFSIARLDLDRVRGRVTGFAGFGDLSCGFPESAMLFEPPARASTARPADILNGASAMQAVPAWPNASGLSRRAKNMIDNGHLAPVSLARIAAQLGVTAAHLSRQFKRDFQMTPSTYLHRLRLADVPLMLALGEEICAVAYDVGYGDVSRFYKQFRKATRTSPGVCREMIAPAADGRVSALR